MQPMGEDTSTTDSTTSTSTSIEKRKRGRPRKHEYTSTPQYSASHNTPLGYQYITPKQFPITMGYNNSLYRPPMFKQYAHTPYQHRIYTPPVPVVAPAPPPFIKKKKLVEVEVEPEEIESEENDLGRVEKLLDYDEEKQEYFVKFRNLSYIHCDWVSKDEVLQAKAGATRIKRFKKTEIRKDYLTIERIMCLENDTVLCKWKELATTLATFEKKEELINSKYESVRESYSKALAAYLRKVEFARPPRVPLEWRPHKEEYIHKREANLRKKESDNKGLIKISHHPSDLTRINVDLQPNNELNDAALFKSNSNINNISVVDNNEEYLTNKIVEENSINKEKDTIQLRKYQIEGLNWLLNRWFYRQSCIMADEMGLGKTVQSVCFIDAVFRVYHYNHLVLVVSPLNTMEHWRREFELWTDLRVLVFRENAAGREMIHEYEFFTDDTGLPLFDVLVTNYETAMSSLKLLSQLRFGIGIFDEAQRLKNSLSKATVTLKTLTIAHKVLLSGTPLQNNLTELWSLLHFINPGYGECSRFLREYKLDSSEDVARLQALLKPIMLRRMKEDVEKTIPLKEETIIEVELTMVQKQYYRAIIEKNMAFLSSKDSSPNLVNTMMELRKCCIHPFLINGAEEYILNMKMDKTKNYRSFDGLERDTIVRQSIRNESKVNDSDEYIDNLELSEDDIYNKNKPIGLNVVSNPKNKLTAAEAYYLAPERIDEYYKILIQSSGKLVLLDKLLAKLHGNHKVLVFSQMTRLLDILSDYLVYKGYAFERIDGGVRADLRQPAIDRFAAGNSFVFLLCTRAGGVGINLTAADTVVIFDSDWNPQNDLQAQARCHRIGQTKEVKIYRLVTRNTYEREMFDKAGLKLGLDRAVLQRMDVTSSPIKRKDAIEILLKKGAYGVLMESDDVSNKFCEEDIDSILERRTKIVKHSDGANVFSKATFQVEEEVDDPEFWEKLLQGKLKEASEGRIKRQIRRISRVGSLPVFTENIIEGKVFNAAAINIDKAVKIDRAVLASIVKYCMDSIGNKKVREDMQWYICELLSNKSIKKLEEGELQTVDDKSNNEAVDDNNSENTIVTLKNINAVDSIENDKTVEQIKIEDRNDFYEKIKEHAQSFLLHVQIKYILKELVERTEIPKEGKGWTQDMDTKLVNFVLKNGYNNYPANFLGKSKDELNSRLRRIILAMGQVVDDNEKNEDIRVEKKAKKIKKEKTANLYDIVMRFGRPTKSNKPTISSIANFDDVEAYVDKIESRKRKNGAESAAYSRILLIDNFLGCELMEVKRSIGLPRSWNVENDKKLQELVAKNGCFDFGSLGIDEEAGMRRIELLVNYCDE